MAGILDQLYPCSFNGVSFLVISTEVSGGRKTISHEFPNQDNRYVEDLGLLNETIRITATLPTEDYFFAREALKAALELKGYGTLIHPFQGIRQAVCSEYRISEETSELGFINFQFTLIVGQELNFPGAGETAASDIFTEVATMFTFLAVAVTALFLDRPQYGRYLSGITTGINDFITIMTSASTLYTVRTEFINSDTAIFNSTFSDYQADVVSYALDGELLVTDTLNLIEKADKITNNGAAGFDVAYKLALYDFSEPLYTITTPQHEFVNTNKLLTKLVVQCGAFGLMCRNAAIYDYGNTSTLEVVRQALINRYDAIKETFLNIDEISASFQLSDLQDSFEEVYSKTIDYLGRLELSLPVLTVVDSYGQSLTPFVYQYYGRIDGIDETILNLNFPNRIDPTNLEPDVTILSE